MSVISFENEKLNKTARDEIETIAEILTTLALLDTHESAERIMVYINHYVSSKKPIVKIIP